MQADRLSPLIGNRYQLGAQLGRGGMGTVYQATDRLTGEQVALKRVTTPTEHLQFASRLSSDNAASGSTNLRMALAQEFHTLASLRHPNIMRVLDYGFDAERQPYLTMDLLDQPLTLLEAGRDQPLEVKINLLLQMLQALAYLHRRSVIHRDLKPDNVAVIRENDTERVRVLDFGLAMTSDYLHVGAPGMAGTLAYMAPEVLQGDDATEASDLYAVGVMAYELLVGVHPFSSDATTHMISKVLKFEPDLAPLLMLTPPPETGEIILLYSEAEARRSLLEIVGRLLAKHPSERYQDAYAVIADLCAATDVPMPEESDAIRESFLQAARFVGREHELSQLRAALTEARAGSGSLWLIGGESGVGKSRLLEELRTRALIAGVLTLRGQAVAAAALPYQLWRDPLRRLILSATLSSDEASVLSTLLPEVGALFDDVPPFDGDDAQRRLTRVIIDLFRRQSEPIVLLFEDLQWATESLELLKRLAPFLAELPLLIVGSFRNDERPRLPDELPQAHLLPLHRLAPDEIAELSISMLGEAGMQRDVTDFLQRETEGNAFFLVETVRALAEEAGSLSRIGQETLPQRLITGGMQQVIWRRLNRVPASARGLLKLAAVIGRELDPALLNEALREGPHADVPDGDLDEWVTICANRAVFEAYEGGWRFAHDKLREALLDSLTPEERAAYHRQAAEAIEMVYAADLKRYAAALVSHWRESGDLLKERGYTLIAGEQAYENNAYLKARDLFARALEIRAYEDAENPTAQCAELHYRLGNALYSMSEYDQAREHHRAGLALYQSIGDRKGISEIITGQGEADMRQGLLDQAEAAFIEALAIRQELHLAKDVGYGYMNLGVIEADREHWIQARDLFKLSLDRMEESGSARDIARALNNYANALDLLGDRDQARRLHHRALEIREREHDLHGVSFSLGNLGSLEFDLENYGEARLLFEKALHIAQQIFDRLAIASDLASLGEVCFKQRDYGQARSYFQQALDLRRKIEDRSGVISSTRELGDVARATGDAAGALLFYHEALALGVEFNLSNQLWSTLQAIAQLLIAQEKPRSALKLLAFVRAQRGTPDPHDQALIDQLEMDMLPNAAASALALGEALTFDGIYAKIEQGTLDF